MTNPFYTCVPIWMGFASLFSSHVTIVDVIVGVLFDQCINECLVSPLRLDTNHDIWHVNKHINQSMVRDIHSFHNVTFLIQLIIYLTYVHYLNNIRFTINNKRLFLKKKTTQSQSEAALQVLSMPHEAAEPKLCQRIDQVQTDVNVFVCPCEQHQDLTAVSQVHKSVWLELLPTQRALCLQPQDETIAGHQLHKVMDRWRDR